MAVQVPPEVNWLFDILCGQSWPEGDEDALRRCARAWQEAALGLGDLAGYLDSTAQNVLANANSMSADDYDEFWKTYVHGGDGTYVALFKQCEPLVKELFAQASEVEYTKIVIIVTLILTAIQIAIAIAAAVGTFGGSLAEVGLAMWVGRQTVLMAVARFVEMALMMLIPDLVAQTVMLAQGHGWDWGKFGTAFENAIVVGSFAALLGPLAGKLPWMSEEAARTLGGKFGALATHFVEGGAVNDLTALTTMGANYGLASLTGNQKWQQQIAQQWSSTNWLAQFAQGGVLADAFYSPHLFGHDGVPMTFTGEDGKSYTDQAGADGQPQFEMVSRVQRSADPVTVPSADSSGDPLTFPPGSIVHYDNAPGPDGEMTGQPYRVEVTEGDVVKIYQAEQPGGPFELTGQVVHSSGILRYFGADAPKYYGANGPGDGAQPLATVSLLTGEFTMNNLPGYLQAHMDRWEPAAVLAQGGYSPGPLAADPAARAGLDRVDPPAGLERVAGLVFSGPRRLVGYDGSDAQMFGLAGRVRDDGVSFLVDVHGGDGQVRAGSTDLGALAPDELKALIEQAGWDGKQRIVLLACDTGQDGAWGESFAAQLARVTGVEVIAPTARVWQAADSEHVYIFGGTWDPASRQFLVDTSKPGGWVSHLPDGQSRPVEADEYGMPRLDLVPADRQGTWQPGGSAGDGLAGGGSAHSPPAGVRLISRGEDGGDESAVPQEPVRILAFITMWDPNAGGVVAVNRQLCEALAAEGHDVYVRVGHSPPDIGIDGIHLIGPRVVDPGIDARYQLTGGYEDLPGQVDVVIGHSRFSGPAAQQVRDEVYPDAQLVHFVHMAPDALGRVQGKPPEVIAENVAIERDLVQHADLAVGVGPRLAEEVRSLAQGSPDGHLPVVHELTPGVEIVDRVPHTGQDPLKIVYLLGRADDPQKGVIQAAEMVRSLGPENAHLVVRGVQPEMVEAQRRQLSDIVGAPVEVRPYSIDHAELVSDLQEADVLVMPSRAEGFGLVALEAAGAGVPVLVPSTSGAGMFLADPARFPADLTEHSIVEQGFEEPVPVARWTDQLKSILDDLPTAQQRALDIQRRLRDSHVTWRAAARSLVDEIRQLEPRPDPAPQQRQSITDALRVEIVRPGEHGQVTHEPVTHEPPRFATIESVIREADHLLVEITDGQRSTTMRVDVDLAARRAVISSLDPNGAWLRDMARRAQPPDGTFDLFGHADSDGFVINGVHVAFGDIARFLPDLPEGTTIRLCGCEAGAGDAVAALAHEANQVVRVTDKPVFEDTRGSVFACTAVEGPDGLIRLVPDPDGRADGRWTDVYPDGHRGEPAPDGFPVMSVLTDGDIVLRLAPGDYFRAEAMFGPSAEAQRRLSPQVREFAGDSGYAGPDPGAATPRDGVAYDQDRLAAVNVRLMGFAEDAIGDGARWTRIYLDGDPRAQGDYKNVLDAIAASRAERLAAVARYRQQGMSDRASTARMRGEGLDIREPGSFINEVAVMHDNVGLGGDGQGWGRGPFEMEKVKLHGIPVEAQYPKGRDAARMQVRSFPDREGSYPDIAGRLDGYRARYSGGDPGRVGEFGRRYADAMLELVRGDSEPPAEGPAGGYPEQLRKLSLGNEGQRALAEITRIGLQDEHCLPLHELAMDTFGLGKYLEFYREIVGPFPVRAFRDAEVGRFLQDAASLTFLNIGLEGARHPENFFTGLMTWHLAAGGVLSLDDALGHFNVMGPQDAGLISRWADWMNGWTYDGHPGGRSGWRVDPPDKYENGIPEPPNSLPAAAEEMRRREREIVALYAQSRGLLGDLNQAFFGNGLPADPQVRERLQTGALRGLIDYLFTHDMRWPSSLELFRPPQES